VDKEPRSERALLVSTCAHISTTSLISDLGWKRKPQENNTTRAVLEFEEV